MHVKRDYKIMIHIEIFFLTNAMRASIVQKKTTKTKSTSLYNWCVLWNSINESHNDLWILVINQNRKRNEINGWLCKGKIEFKIVVLSSPIVNPSKMLNIITVICSVIDSCQINCRAKYSFEIRVTRWDKYESENEKQWHKWQNRNRNENNEKQNNTTRKSKWPHMS